MFDTLLVQPLFNLLIFIYAIIPGHDFGVAIILFTILVRLALWPVITKQLHSQKVMQKLGPEIARVRKEAKGDKQKENQALMDLYKERGINPLAPILPLFVQMPILFALFFVIQNTLHDGEIARATYSFLRNSEAIKAVIADSSAFHASLFGFDLSKPSIIMAFLAGITQFLQSRQLLPKNPDPNDPNVKTTQLMSYIFPVIMVFIANGFPAALPLYWAVTSLVAMVQQHIVLNQDVEEMEAAK